MVSKIIKQIKGTKITQRVLNSEGNLSGIVLQPTASGIFQGSILSMCPAQRLFP